MPVWEIGWKTEKGIVSVSNRFCVHDLGSWEIHGENKNEDGRAVEGWARDRIISAYLDIKIVLALHVVIIDNNAAR